MIIYKVIYTYEEKMRTNRLLWENALFLLILFCTIIYVTMNKPLRTYPGLFIGLLEKTLDFFGK